MINTINGSIEIPGYNTVLAKGVTTAEIKQKPVYHQLATRWSGTKEYSVCWFGNITDKNYSIGISIMFHYDALYQIDLYTYHDGDPSGWDDWSEDKMMVIYRRNNAFLDDELGYKGVVANTPYPLYEYTFDWGVIFSTFDIRSGSSTIGIRYN